MMSRNALLRSLKLAWVASFVPLTLFFVLCVVSMIRMITTGDYSAATGYLTYVIGALLSGLLLSVLSGWIEIMRHEGLAIPVEDLKDGTYERLEGVFTNSRYYFVYIVTKNLGVYYAVISYRRLPNRFTMKAGTWVEVKEEE